MSQPFDEAFAFQPFGIGTPVAAPEPPTGPIKMSRFIDPATRDFQIDPDTLHIAEMPPVRQRFMLLATTVLGSSAVLPDMGIQIPALMDETFARRVDVAVRVAARQMTDIERVARIINVAVDVGSLGRARIRIDYDDLTLGTQDSVTTP